MIVKKSWVKKSHTPLTPDYCYEGIFLFGIIPIYIERKKLYYVIRGKWMGIRFRIANWIMRDYLRNYLAVGVRISLLNALRYGHLSELNPYVKNEIEKSLKTIDELFEMWGKWNVPFSW